jgi:hypothetical protein
MQAQMNVFFIELIKLMRVWLAFNYLAIIFNFAVTLAAMWATGFVYGQEQKFRRMDEKMWSQYDNFKSWMCMFTFMSFVQMVGWIFTVTSLNMYSFPFMIVNLSAFFQWMAMFGVIGNKAFMKATADEEKEKVYVEMPNNAYAGLPKNQVRQ